MAEVDSFVKVNDVDPAADFIAREQNALAEIENDIDFKPSNSSNQIDQSEEVTITSKDPAKEPEKIIKWRDDQQRLLKMKDEEETKKKQELGEQAKRELEEWYSRYEEQLDKSKLNNR